MKSSKQRLKDDFELQVKATTKLIQDSKDDYILKLKRAYEREQTLIPLNIQQMSFELYLIELAKGNANNYFNLTYMVDLDGLKDANEVSSTTLIDQKKKSRPPNNKSTIKGDKYCAKTQTKCLSSITPKPFDKNNWETVEKRLPRSDEIILSMNGSPLDYKPMKILTCMDIDCIDLDNLEIPDIAKLQKQLNQLQTKVEKTIKVKKVQSKKTKKN